MSQEVTLHAQAEPRVAVTYTSGLLRGLRELAKQGVDAGGIDANVCFIIASSLDSAVALMDSIERSALP